MAATSTRSKSKKEETAIQSSDVNDVLKAIATGDVSGVDPTVLAAIAKQMGFSLTVGEEAAEKAPRFSRKGVVERWAAGETALSEKEAATIDALPQVIGTGSIADPASVTQDEIDAVVYEFVTLRDTEDPVKGRKSKLRDDVIAVILARGGESADLVSTKNGYKLAVTKKGGGKGEANLAKLEEVLTEEQWKAISVEETVRVVDPTKLALALADPKIEAAVAEITPDVPVTYAVTPRPVKKGDVIA